jgi:hypothetical protein
MVKIILTKLFVLKKSTVVSVNFVNFRGRGTWNKRSLRTTAMLDASICAWLSSSNARSTLTSFADRGSVSRSPNKLKTHPKGWDFNLAGETGLEPATPGFGDRCSTN